MRKEDEEEEERLDDAKQRKAEEGGRRVRRMSLYERKQAGCFVRVWRMKKTVAVRGRKMVNGGGTRAGETKTRRGTAIPDFHFN